ncbi:MAG TPA: hypothetical protein DCL07_05705 [Cryomorphaceae bacterium]|nr:hypothetical protein [Cryomorphaceae bacterium]
MDFPLAKALGGLALPGLFFCALPPGTGLIGWFGFALIFFTGTFLPCSIALSEELLSMAV